MVKKLSPTAQLDIHFLHVLAVPDTVTMNVAGEIETCGEIDVNYVLHQKEIAGRKLAELQSLYGNEIQSHLVLGKITDAILDYSEENHFGAGRTAREIPEISFAETRGRRLFESAEIAR